MPPTIYADAAFLQKPSVTPNDLGLVLRYLVLNFMNQKKQEEKEVSVSQIH